MTTDVLSDEACNFLVQNYTNNRWGKTTEKPKIVTVNKEYYEIIEKDSHILEILSASNDPDVEAMVEKATKEYEADQVQVEGLDYKYGDQRGEI